MVDVRTKLKKAFHAGREPIRRARRAFHQRRAGAYSVDLSTPWLGFFAQLQWLLEILAYAEETRQNVQVKLTGKQYVTPSRGPDFLRYFFEPVQPDRPLQAKFWHRVGELSQLRLPRAYDKSFTFESAHELFFRHYRFRPEVKAELDAIERQLFAGKPTLGVHFRGTDKKSEADRVPPERMLAAVDAELAKMPPDARLFVATDEQPFLDSCIAKYGDRVVALTDSHRSTDDKPVHISPTGDGYALARDALFNCLMLSRCTKAIKTASILSSWAKVFRPELDLRTLSRRAANRAYFPERAVPDYEG